MQGHLALSSQSSCLARSEAKLGLGFRVRVNEPGPGLT